MTGAFVNGQAVPFERAVHDAARLLARARLPVITGLDTDAGALRAAVRLAERIGGVVDQALRSGGGLIGAPEELKRLATCVLAIGSAAPGGFATAKIERLKDPRDLAALRAAVNGRKNRAKDTLSGTLLGATPYVALWNAEDLDTAETEMAMGLVKDLNAATRFSALPVFADPAALGADTILGWMTGFPARTSLARGFADHDAWTHSAERLIGSGEADVALWVSAAPADWPKPIATIAISPRPRTARIAFETGEPGVDHDSALFSGGIGTFVNAQASAPSAKRSAAAVLAAIMEALP
jgi:formylmethanofuran dehydrogenase subunit B